MNKILITIAIGLALTGCGGGGPSKDDVEAALIQHFEQASAGMRPTFQNLEVGACEKVEGGPGHACSVSGQAQFDVGGRTQQEPLAGTFIFDQIGGRWTVVSAR